jgi:hypothetical protein
MRWNYTNTALILLVAHFGVLAVPDVIQGHPEWMLNSGHAAPTTILAAIVCLPFTAASDVISWRRHRRQLRQSREEWMASMTLPKP